MILGNYLVHSTVSDLELVSWSNPVPLFLDDQFRIQCFYSRWSGSDHCQILGWIKKLQFWITFKTKYGYVKKNRFFPRSNPDPYQTQVGYLSRSKLDPYQDQSRISININAGYLSRSKLNIYQYQSRIPIKIKDGYLSRSKPDLYQEQNRIPIKFNAGFLSRSEPDPQHDLSRISIMIRDPDSYTSC